MNYIYRLQNLDNDSKKVCLVVLTAISVVVVVTLWLFYLNATVVAVDEPEKPGFWRVFKTGLGVVGEKVEFGLANSYIYFSQGKKINLSK